jgi:hypothetical protein
MFLFIKKKSGAMKKSSDNTASSGKTLRKPACFMAYTLNNTQPVVCTIVADQPYFYMDDACIEEDDAIFYEDELGNIENELADLRQKMEAYERMSQNFQNSPRRHLEEFAAEAINITEACLIERTDILQPADRISNMILQSRMGRELLEFAHLHGVYIVESDQAGTARYERTSETIFIHPELGEMESYLLAVRELRRHWQHRKGAMLHPLTFHPDHAILINRAQQADLTIAMIRVAWELQLAGHRDAWAFIENSPMDDLARAFAREAFVDFRSLFDGKASSAVFESWFLSERCRHQDKRLIQAMLADHQGYVFQSEEMSRTVSIDLIQALGAQPFGKNYLSPYAQMIMDDAIFTEVRDRSNANFLWFIKFERSFRETEQALQSSEDLNGSGILPAQTSSEQDQHVSQSVVIPLPGRSKLIPKSKRGKSGRKLELDDPRANVIHVRFGNAEGA